MRCYDLIKKKRDGGTLTEGEIRFLVQGYVDGRIPDYQMAALLMAIYFRGMEDEETAVLTDAMAGSGDVVDLGQIPGVKVDKHSTGGVGDKTTLIVAPIVAACGVKVAKMSGRGLGHTGGTVDKLESIPGVRTAFTREEFFDIVRKAGLAVAGQSGNLAPADKKLYALRDVTATVESIPLIAASIMSKKLAAGSDCILLDVKTGSGAFMKTLEDAVSLAEKMVAIGTHRGKRTMALITNMDSPLGNQIGNTLEVLEAVQTLKGQGPGDLAQVCLNLAGNMLYLAEKGSREECMRLALEAIRTGAALEKLVDMVSAQGGAAKLIYEPERLPKAAFTREVRANCAGYLVHMDAEECGRASCLLGAGRMTKEDAIDYGAGITLHRKMGDYVEAGEAICTLHADSEDLFPEAEQVFLKALEFGQKAPEKKPLIYARVEANGVKYE